MLYRIYVVYVVVHSTQLADHINSLRVKMRLADRVTARLETSVTPCYVLDLGGGVTQPGADILKIVSIICVIY